MIMAIISVEPIGIPLISSVLCGPKKNYKIGLKVYHKKKKRKKERVEIYFDISTFQITDVEDDDLPSNNMRINKNNAKIGGLI